MFPISFRATLACMHSSHHYVAKQGWTSHGIEVRKAQTGNYVFQIEQFLCVFLFVSCCCFLLLVVFEKSVQLPSICVLSGVVNTYLYLCFLGLCSDIIKTNRHDNRKAHTSFSTVTACLVARIVFPLRGFSFKHCANKPFHTILQFFFMKRLWKCLFFFSFELCLDVCFFVMFFNCYFRFFRD